MGKRITFLLNSQAHLPAGGKRIVYEYANRLARRGWRVTVVHPVDDAIDLSPKRSVFALLRCVKWRLMGQGSPTSWFTFEPSVRLVFVPFLCQGFIPDADYVVACPVQSAFWARNYPPRKGAKLYFIQHLEDWEIPREQALSSWHFPMRKIVIANWLLGLAKELGEDAVLINNGIDSSFFRVLKPFGQRSPRSILMLHHDQKWKGTRFAVEAVQILRQRYPDLLVRAFSTSGDTRILPSFVTHVPNPSQSALRDLYNDSAIFIAPSLAEGFALPPCEAMLCGCAVVATDIPGHRDYLLDGVNGLACRPGSVDSIVEKVEFLLHNPSVAAKLSECAPATLAKFDWGSRVDLFEKAVLAPWHGESATRQTDVGGVYPPLSPNKEIP